jgi:hypothetical protein
MLHTVQRTTVRPSSAAAERSATAAENAVAEQQRANSLTAEQHRREDAERAVAQAAAETNALAEARRINVLYSGNSGVDVLIDNDSGGSVVHVRLVDLTGDPPTWRWTLNHMIPGNTDLLRQIAPGAQGKIQALFHDENGRLQRMLQPPYRSRVRFTDAAGRRWEITEDAEPRRVPDDESDLYPRP